MPIEDFQDLSLEPAVRGYLARPPQFRGDGLVLTHGASGNAGSVLLVSMAEAFSAIGLIVLCANLPFRQARSWGPPQARDAVSSRLGLKSALAALRKLRAERLFLGGQSYGGRQASMLCAEEKVAEGLLLFSYPLHAPNRPGPLRTEHWPRIEVPVMFVHGTRDPFGSLSEIEEARRLITAKTRLLVVEGAGHDLGFKGKHRPPDLATKLTENFQEFFALPRTVG
jgi:predicted alpha/beta-hydrolase family hydrolase